MSIKSGANFITDGLVFDIDPSNSKSYFFSDENRLTNSISISSTWPNNGTVTKTLNYATAPDGTNTAIKVDTTGGYSGPYQYFNTTTGDTYIYSIYLKYLSGDNTIMFGSDGGSISGALACNMSNGTFYTNFGTISNSGSVYVGNGWYRFYFSITSPTTASMPMTIYSLSGSTSSSFLAWGPQVQKATTVGKYVPTTDAVVGSKTAYDLSLNKYSGTLTNGVSYNSSNNGYFTFDGSDDYIDLQSPSALDLYSQFTLSTWFKTSNTSSYQTVFARGRGNSQWSGYEIGTNSGYARVTAENAAGTSTTFDLQIGTNVANNIWHNVVFTFNGTSGSIYVDGVLANATSGSFTSSSWNNYIGRRNAQGYFNGSIGKVSAYNRSLTSTEVLQNFNAIRARYGI